MAQRRRHTTVTDFLVCENRTYVIVCSNAHDAQKVLRTNNPCNSGRPRHTAPRRAAQKVCEKNTTLVSTRANADATHFSLQPALATYARYYIMAPDIDVSMLIQEIQNRPAIYDTSKPEYHDRNLKRKMWDEVCCNIYSAPVWTSMTSNEKTKFGKEIQTKWNSLRSCFRRELSAQKNIPSGSERKKKRKYIYFDSLLFLLPFTVIENNESSIEIEQSSESLDVTTVHSSDTESIDSKRPKMQTKKKTNCYDEQKKKTAC
ncbi:uncharacterized protein LOC128199634 [Bicyclus anynana]|uniref:Uncharacterized protein LOC128199634 n=1 Tax=Bicyclus anynana TaxID=110368 RepID=A0ABM3M2W3_BICAN|nr:uncharacterized protein LOC128199634 [Bicyclus anynana]